MTQSNPDNPVDSCVFEPENASLFEKSPNETTITTTTTKTLDLRVTDLRLIGDVSLLDTDPWTLATPTVRFDRTTFKKKQQTLKHINNFIHLFQHSSNTGQKTT